MIVGFSKHGKGGGKAPIRYLTDPAREGRENAPPEVLRGDPDHTQRLIDSLDFEHKYTSGVLSFAPGEEVTPEMEETIMDRFESLAFAGLDQDQYNILWVQHTHAGHHELHFLTPRVELGTGKSLNIKPPGKMAGQHFDDFRSEINARYGLADPEDPSRARNVSTPDHELKIASEALRSGEKPPSNVRELIDEVLSQRAVNGLIRSREDVLEQVKDLGLDVTRSGKDYITVTDQPSGQRWRLKGPLYTNDYEPGRALEKADKRRKRNYSKPSPSAVKHYEARVEQHIGARARYHQGRYQRAKQRYRLDRLQEQDTMADLNRVEPLDRYLRRELGPDRIPIRSDYSPSRSDDSNGEEPQKVEQRRRQNPVQYLRQAFVRPDRRERADLSERLPNLEGVLNEGARESLVEGVKSTVSGISKTARSVTKSAESLRSNVQGNLSRQRESTQASRQLEQSSRTLERANQEIRHLVLDEQKSMKERQLQRQQKQVDASTERRPGPTLRM